MGTIPLDIIISMNLRTELMPKNICFMRFALELVLIFTITNGFSNIGSYLIISEFDSTPQIDLFS